MKNLISFFAFMANFFKNLFTNKMVKNKSSSNHKKFYLENLATIKNYKEKLLKNTFEPLPRRINYFNRIKGSGLTPKFYSLQLNK